MRRYCLSWILDTGESKHMASKMGIAALILVGFLAAASSADADCGNLGSVTFNIATVPNYPGPQQIYVAVAEIPSLSAYVNVNDAICLPAGSYTLSSGMFFGYGPNIGPNANTAYTFGTVNCVGTTQVTCGPQSFSFTEHTATANVHGSVKNNGEPVGAAVLINVFSVDLNQPVIYCCSFGPYTDAGGNYGAGNGTYALIYSYGESGSQRYRIWISADCSADVTAYSNLDVAANLDCVDLPPCIPCWQAGGGGGSSPPGPPGSAGLPINVTTGNVWLRHQDVSIPGLFGLSLARRYDSDYANRNLTGAFGVGWHHSYERSLTILSAHGVRLRGEDGSPLVFRDDDGDLTYTPYKPITETSWIVKSAQGTYTRYFPDGGTESYDAQGHWVGAQDDAGNPLTMTYDTRRAPHDRGGRRPVADLRVRRIGPRDAAFGPRRPHCLLQLRRRPAHESELSGRDRLQLHLRRQRPHARDRLLGAHRGAARLRRPGTRHALGATGRRRAIHLHLQRVPDDRDRRAREPDDLRLDHDLGASRDHEDHGPVLGLRWRWRPGPAMDLRHPGPHRGLHRRRRQGDDLRLRRQQQRQPHHRPAEPPDDHDLGLAAPPCSRKTGPGRVAHDLRPGPGGPDSITEKVTTTQNRTTGITYTAAGQAAGRSRTRAARSRRSATTRPGT